MLKVIRNGWIVTQNKKREIIRGDIAIEDEKIAYVGKNYKDCGDVEIDAEGDIVMPGMINTHTHIAMAPLKGVCDDLLFPDFLNKVFKIDSDRTDYDLTVGTKLGCMEMMLGGTTTFVDLYYSEDVIAKAVQESGLRGVLCWCCLDEQFTTQKGNPLQNCKHFYERFKDTRKIVPGVGLQGVYVCGEETCVGAKEFSEEKNLPLNFHLSETKGEVDNHIKSTGKRPLEWLDDIGALTPNMIAAHSAYLTPEEVQIMGQAGMSVSLCAVSNMKLATGGVAPVPEFLDNDVNISIGTDSNNTNNSLDMFSEMKIAGLLHKSARSDATVAPAQQLLDFCTINGAKAIGMENELGSLEVGKYADVIILDGKAPNLRPLLPENMVANLAYSASSFNVKTVLCQGDIIVKNREIMSMATDDVLDASEDVWKTLCMR